jgi:hypothetical protein
VNANAGKPATTTTRPKRVLATVIGWLIVAIIAWWLLGFILGTLAFILRSFLWIVVLGGLLWAYLALKAPDDD